jgi:phosphoesterase RecJ-like protein
MFIREIRPRFHKISLRAKANVDVNKIAKKFNGGGHTRAAGCRIDGTKREVIEKVLKEIKKQL